MFYKFNRFASNFFFYWSIIFYTIFEWNCLKNHHCYYSPIHDAGFSLYVYVHTYKNIDILLHIFYVYLVPLRVLLLKVTLMAKFVHIILIYNINYLKFEIIFISLWQIGNRLPICLAIKSYEFANSLTRSQQHRARYRTHVISVASILRLVMFMYCIHIFVLFWQFFLIFSFQ